MGSSGLAAFKVQGWKKEERPVRQVDQERKVLSTLVNFLWELLRSWFTGQENHRELEKEDKTLFKPPGPEAGPAA